MVDDVQVGWYKVCVDLQQHASGTVSELLFDLGSCGLEEQCGTAYGKTRLTAYFSDDVDSGRVLAGLEDGLNALKGDQAAVSVELKDVPPEDWAETWKARFKPVSPIPNLVICPPWERVDDPEGGFSLVIEPKTAFGTGQHETTRLSLRMLHAAVSPGDTVLDVGTGSGILSLAAAGFGASRVTGIDVDALAVENARANQHLNERGNVVFRTGTLEDESGEFDVVVANIESRILNPMLPALVSHMAPRGDLILGGVLVQEQAELLKPVRGAGLQVVEVREENGWLGIRAVR